MNNKKKLFIKNEFYILSWSASVQRIKTYKDNVKDSDKLKFKNKIINFLDTEIIPNYKNRVSEKDHLNNILNLKYKADNFKNNFLHENNFNIGKSQKLLNLSLKYFWVNNWIMKPPHCPIDSIVLHNAKIKNIKWTKINSIDEYIKIIEDIKLFINDSDIANWELENFNRRSFYK